MRYQKLLASLSLGGFVLGLAIALTGAFGTRLGFWNYALGVKILEPGVGVGTLALIAGATWITRALWHNESEGWRIGMAGLVGSALLVGVPADYLWLSYSLPAIHDISTDIGDAPKFDTLLGWRKGAPNPATYDGPIVVTYQGARITTSVAQKYAYMDIKTQPFMTRSLPQKTYFRKLFWRSLNAVNALDWQVASFDLKSGRIEATDTSFWFGTVSDIVIRVRPAGAFGVLIDVRAKSRVGTADMGRNAELVRDLLAKVKGA